ncbi:MAG: hypothetical protein R3337_00135 [Gammaproteobacteria bacterium]|nr:hypothetical protein [Gammaproteobacteria bacterium]
MDDQPVSRGEYSRVVELLHKRITDTEKDLERRIEDGDRAVARHAKNNYTQGDAELQRQIVAHHEVLFGGRGSKGVVIQMTELATTQASTEPVLRELKQSVDSLRFEMAKNSKRSSDSSGGHKAVREAWASTPGGQKVLLAIAALLLAAAGALGGYQMAPDQEPPQPTPVAPTD